MVFWSRKHQGIYGGFAEDFEGFMEDLRRILGGIGFGGDGGMRVWGCLENQGKKGDLRGM
jgi:hypothetical protein